MSTYQVSQLLTISNATVIFWSIYLISVVAGLNRFRSWIWMLSLELFMIICDFCCRCSVCLHEWNPRCTSFP